ncbi:uncharacterized protein JCM15063_001348 [Sporobolomyces koalae]|uniref:uncharacterized protein n=1 Tax=Sporobolomyces koalae TaxID=500713 RepID=UPI0031813A21
MASPTSPTVQERLLGTLIVIVLRAKNLPNRVRIGKQNPYATVTYGLHKKRTETIERGGQQPNWDAEFRFEILKEEFENEQLEVGGAAVVDRKGGVLPMSTKDSVTGINRLEKPKPTVTVGDGRRILKLACWADDNRDPKLIGEGELNIEDTIRKGKFDDWVKLERKGRYAGEVYLELTWYSNERKPSSLHRPERSDSPTRSSYGGAGSRLGEEEEEEDSEEREAVPSNNGHPPFRASLDTSNAGLSLAPDYPDPDLAPLSSSQYPDADLDPLTRSMSALSVARPPLPQPPIPAGTSSISYSHTYNQMPVASMNSYDDIREGSQHGYPYQPSPHHEQQRQPEYNPTPQPGYSGYPAHSSEFGVHGEHGQASPAPAPQPYQQLGEFEQLAHQHYANNPQVYDQSSVSSQRPLPQPGAPSTHAFSQPYEVSGYTPPAASASPYPPVLPQPPVPPIPPSTSVYWQKQQQFQQQRQQQYEPPVEQQSQYYHHQAQQPGLPPSATYPTLPSATSYQYLPHLITHTSLHPSPSTPSFAPSAPFASVPPPPVLGHSYPVPPHSTAYAPSYAAPPPVFSPPPPPPSLQNPSSQADYSPYAPAAYPPPHDPGYGAGQQARPPLPPPPPIQQQQYRPY